MLKFHKKGMESEIWRDFEKLFSKKNRYIYSQKPLQHPYIITHHCNTQVILVTDILILYLPPIIVFFTYDNNKHLYNNMFLVKLPFYNNYSFYKNKIYKITAFVPYYLITLLDIQVPNYLSTY